MIFNFNGHLLAKWHKVIWGSLLSLLLVASVAACDSSGSTVNQSVPGDQTHFDPIAAYDTIHKAVGADMVLDSIDIYYVRSDGTLDLTAGYEPHVDYTFARALDAPPPSVPPIGVSGVTTDQWYEMARVYLKKDSMEINRANSQSIKPMPTPTCPLHTLWSVALEKGARKDAVATIYISASGYYFQIDALNVNLNFDLTCHLKS